MTKQSICIYCKATLDYVGSRTKLYCNEKCRNAYRYSNNLVKQHNVYNNQQKRGVLKKLKAINLLGGVCSRCGQAHPAALCFHHTDPSLKAFTLDLRVFANQKWSVLLGELNKCELLCYSCHHIHHYGALWDNIASAPADATARPSDPVE